MQSMAAVICFHGLNAANRWRERVRDGLAGAAIVMIRGRVNLIALEGETMSILVASLRAKRHHEAV